MSNLFSSTKNKKEILTPDLLILGAGSGGFSAAITAAEEGASVVMVGEGTIGGTCVNTGCVPSKTLIRATETLYQAKASSRFKSIEASAKLTDWSALIAQKNDLVHDLRTAKYIDVLKAYHSLQYIEGHGKFVSDGVQVGEVLYHPKKVIIATGATASLPPIDGILDVPYLTNVSALDLEKQPESLLIIGGGVIGVELAQLFARAGTKVTICCRSRLLPTTEPEISAALATYLKEEGVEVCEGIGYQKIEKTSNSIKLTHIKEGFVATLEAEKVLVATGRKSNTSHMGLEDVGIELLKNGGIKTDAHKQTTNESVYAVGDVTGEDMFVYMAAYAGKIAAKNALHDHKISYDNHIMPTVVFSDPQVADVGLTEAQARAFGYDVKTSVLTLDHVPRYIAARDTRGLIKLVADAQTDKLLGAHILAPEAGDLIQSCVFALKGGLTITEIANTIYPYLTGVEGIKLAAQIFNKDVEKLSCCAG